MSPVSWAWRKGRAGAAVPEGTGFLHLQAGRPSGRAGVRVRGWMGSGRLQGRGVGAAHLVAEEAGETALGANWARGRQPADVPEAQRAVVRGGVEHLAVYLRAQT